MKIFGRIKKVLATQTGEGKNGAYYKRTFVVETLDDKLKQIAFTLFGEKKVELIDEFDINQLVTVYFEIDSRPYEKDGFEFYISELSCYAIKPL